MNPENLHKEMEDMKLKLAELKKVIAARNERILDLDIEIAKLDVRLKSIKDGNA